MNRPTRQRTHLLEKIQLKETRSLKKAGKRTKRWRKWVESYKTIAGEGATAPSDSQPSAE